MKIFSSLRIPVTVLVIGFCWGALSNPLITFFFSHLTLIEQDVYRSLNDLIFVGIISVVLYVKIKKQHRKLIKSEEQYRQLFEANPHPLWIYNNETFRIVKVNNAALKKYLYTKKQFLKMTVWDIRLPGNYNEPANAISGLPDELRASGYWKHLKATGETVEVSIVSYPVLFNNQSCSLVIVTDITDLLEKERKLQDAYQKIKAFNDTLLHIAWSNSHELRKPVCSIISLISLLQHADSNQERRQYLNLLETCSTELDEVLKQNEKMMEVNTAVEIEVC